MIQLHLRSESAAPIRAVLEETGLPYVETPPPADRPFMVLTDPEGPEGLWRTTGLDSALIYLARKSGMWGKDEAYRNLGFKGHVEETRIGGSYRWEWTREILGLEERLGRQDYLEGAFSIDDVAAYASNRAYFREKLPAGEFPNIHRWLARMAARPIIAKHLPD